MKRFESALASAGLAVALAALAAVGCSEDETTNGDTPLEPGVDAAVAQEPGPGLDAAVTDPNADAGQIFDGACGGTMVKATARDANMLLVLDRSGSMRQRPAGFSVNKWDAVKIALRDALNPVKEKISLGLELFPNDMTGGSDACAMPGGGAAVIVPVGPGTETVDKIVGAVNAAAPDGATPTAKALAEAHAYFSTGPGKDLVGERYVILATDGGPNCGTMSSCTADMCTTNIDGACASGNCCDPATGGSRTTCLDADAVVAQLNSLRAIGVRTFVVGIPGTEAYKTYLDQFAVAGGAENPVGPNKYYSVSASGDVAGLTAVFALITGEMITSCRISLDETVPDPQNVNVYVDETVIPQGGDNGWDYDLSTTPPSIVIKGSTCEQVKTRGAKAISVVYGCPTIH